MSSTPSGNRIRARDAFCLGAAVALLALLPAILPYGGRYVTRGDLIEQQLPFIAEARRILRGGLNSYSFSTFLGAPALGSYAFYTLGSPFVWPLALLPQALLPYGIAVMAVLKHACAALTSFLYFRRMTRNDRLSLAGCILYAFSSFTVVNAQFYHFTEIIAFFPLILLGLEDAMGDSPRFGALALACALNTLVNYYFMFSSALLAALYFAFRFFSPDWAGRRRVRRAVRTVFECGAGCALAGVLLVPAAFSMLTITRTGAGASLFKPYSLSFLLERLRALLMPIESNVVHAWYGDAGNWCSTACTLPLLGATGAAVLFLCRDEALRGERWLRRLLAAMLLMSAYPALCGLFVLESNTAYTRWWYALALMMTLATLKTLALAQERPRVMRRAYARAFALCTLLVCLLIGPFLLPQTALDALASLGALPARVVAAIRNRQTGEFYAQDVFRVFSLGMALLGGAGTLFLLVKKPSFRVSLALLCAFAAVNYGGYLALSDAYTLSGAFEQKYTLREIAEPTLSALSLEPQESYTRISYGPRIRNYGLLRGQSSITCYHSLRSSYVGRFVTAAGFGYDESTTVYPPNDDPALRAFLSVSEYHQTDGEPVPTGFVYDREENGFAVYTNENALPMGFVQTVCTGHHAQRMDENTLGTVLLAAVTLDDADLDRFSARLQPLDVYAIPDWQESAARLRENACDRFITRADGFYAHIDAKEAGLLVFTIPYDKGFRATIDGQPAEIVPCDLSFMSVFVEAGEHDIDFTYHTRGLTLGIALSAICAAVLCAYVALMRRFSSVTDTRSVKSHG